MNRVFRVFDPALERSAMVIDRYELYNELLNQEHDAGDQRWPEEILDDCDPAAGVGGVDRGIRQSGERHETSDSPSHKTQRDLQILQNHRVFPSP